MFSSENARGSVLIFFCEGKDFWKPVLVNLTPIYVFQPMVASTKKTPTG